MPVASTKRGITIGGNSGAVLRECMFPNIQVMKSATCMAKPLLKHQEGSPPAFVRLKVDP
jgi:hypothetical protein